MKKLFSLILIALLCLSLFAGCGRAKTNTYVGGESAMPGEADSSLKLGDTLEESDRKIIVTVNMRVETKTFDPNLHNAVMHIENEELGENVISQVFQAGFRCGEKVIRFSMVQVAN